MLGGNSARPGLRPLFGELGSPGEDARGCSQVQGSPFLFALTCAWEHSTWVYTQEPHTYGQKKTV